MIEAWLSASDTIRSVSPVIVGMTPVFAVKPDWKVRTAGALLELGELRLERLVHRHRAGDGPNGPAPGPEFADSRGGRIAYPRMMGQPEVVVRRQADQPAVVDRHDRALRRGHDPQRAIQMPLAQRRRPRRRGRRAGRGGRPDRAGLRAAHDVQSMMTLPESPARAAANAASNSRNPNRWVMAGVMSSPDWSMTVILYQVSYISRP